ncbi:MAG: T9SS type A sorting domain-containing protein, partial [Flavobacteriales bacterium]|nr:T9SS type A sorting domain-containing protein [Flavobacteriales bacterium]
DTDTDLDGTADCVDGCPADPNKIAPGDCGCGNVDEDLDSDGITDCIDPCPGDPNNTCTDCNDPCYAENGTSTPCTTFLDADSDGTCDANDGCPNDPDKIAPGVCGCGVADTDTDSDGTADCNDGCPNDPNKVDPGACGCGVVDTDTDNDGIADCNDNCPDEPGQIGSTCDDGNSNTTNDQLDANCNCIGTPVGDCNPLYLEFQTEIDPGQVTWEILDETGAITVDNGAVTVPPGSIGTLPLCLDDGCYRLRVTDASGDGILGYELREADGGQRRIIDNTGNMVTGVSAIANGGTFCVPIGDIDLIFSSCDKLDWVNNKYLVCHADDNVTAQWQVGNQNDDGYNFWIFDPNGSYSFRRFRTHAVSDGFSPAGPYRAAHLKINGWTNTALTPHVPANVLLNVRVRGVYNWTFTEWGPTCTMMIDPARAACPLTNLQNDPAFGSSFSCGVTRNFGGSNSNANRVVANPPQFQPAPLAGGTGLRYQFRFRNGERCIVLPPRTSPTLYLNWNASVAPPLVASETYNVDVRVSKDQGATWCTGLGTSDPVSNCADPDAWGVVCNVTIGEVIGLMPEGSNMSGTTGIGELTAYPNPNSGEQLNINLTEVGRDVTAIGVEFYDLHGRKVFTEMVPTAAGTFNTTLELSGDLSNGVYLMRVTAGANIKTERIVIQR